MRIIHTESLTQEALARLGVMDREWVYNGLDACLTYEIDNELDSVMDDIARGTYQMSLALQAPILEMNMRGIKIDLAERDRAIASLSTDAQKVDSQFDYLCRSIFGREVNPASPKQVIDLFYNWLALPEQKKRNSKGEYAVTTDREALEKLAQLYYPAKPFVSHILKSRDIWKQIGTLSTPLLNGRFYTSLAIAGTKTGRLASALSDFAVGSNLQNIDRRIKRMFIADEGKKFANVDLEQADARNVGAQTWNLFPELGDTNRFLDFAESGDLHTAVCALCWRELDWTNDPKENRAIADQPAYREKSYRDLAKILGHGCLTADHEVLTPEGWVGIADKPTTILQWEPGTSREGLSKFVSPSHWEDHEYVGELQTFESLEISARMTADHRVPFKRDPSSSIVYEAPAALGPQKFMPLGGGFVGGDITVPARLIAAVMADGHIEKDWISFHFHKGRKFARLTSLCDHYGYECRIYGDKLRVKATLPKYPGAFMLQWMETCIRDFIDELKYWDGSIGKSAITISSTERTALEWYQTLGRLVGVGGNISKPYTSGFGSTVYRLQQNRRAYANGNTVKWTRSFVNSVPVYCPTVPSGWFYVRRNGKIFITGNTNFNGQPPQMSKHSKVAQGFIVDFQARYFGAFPEVKKRIEWVGNELVDKGYLITAFGRRRHFLKRRGDNKTLNEGCAFDPQSMTADEINNAMLRFYQFVKPRFPSAELMIQVHDSLLIQYDEADEEAIIPWIKLAFKVPLTLRAGRQFHVPCEVQVGWNWDYRQDWTEKDYKKGKCAKEQIGTCKENPNGMIKYKGRDTRTRA